VSPGARWIAGLIGLLVVNAIAMVTLAATAGDPATRVLPDYYRKAVAWDDLTAARAASAALGWTAELGVEHGSLIATIHDRDGRAVTGAAVEATLRPRVRADEQRRVVLTELGAGRYAADLTRPRHGLHDVEVTARVDGATLLATGVVEP
jgi:nitrogen fixation protein FixH